MRSVDGDFLADTSGLWQWSDSFFPPNAVYKFELDQFQVSSTAYPAIMTELKGAVQYYGSIMMNLTLAENLVYWTSWYTGDVVDGKVQKFYMFSNPAIIFDREYIEGTVSNVYSDCNASSLGSFDASNYLLSLVFDANEFMSNDQCVSIINPTYLGYNAIYDGNDFSIGIDVRSLMTTLSINNLVIPLESLSVMPDQLFSYDYANITYAFGKYYDPRYPGMKPVSCISNNEILDAEGYAFQYCFFSLKANQYALPLFNHFGYDVHEPSYCECDGTFSYVYTRHIFCCVNFYLMSCMWFRCSWYWTGCYE